MAGIQSDSRYNQLDPAATFRFWVEIGAFEAIFMECTISPLEWEIKDVKEGGRNDYVHWLPGRRKAGKVTLKYGLTTDLSLLPWYQETLDESFNNYRQSVSITLKMTDRTDLITWDLENAIPSKITWPALKTSDNAVAIETLELAYQGLTITDRT